MSQAPERGSLLNLSTTISPEHTSDSLSSTNEAQFSLTLERTPLNSDRIRTISADLRKQLENRMPSSDFSRRYHQEVTDESIFNRSAFLSDHISRRPVVDDIIARNTYLRDQEFVRDREIRTDKLSSLLRSRADSSTLRSSRILLTADEALADKNSYESSRHSLSRLLLNRPSIEILAERGVIGEDTVINTVPSQSILRRVDAIHNVIQVSAGWGHTLVRTESGQVYSFGCTTNGRLGLGISALSLQSITDPTPIPTFDTHPASVIACGDNHCGAISNGRLFMWGCGSWGRLGTGLQHDEPSPVEISLPEGEFAKDVNCGTYHTLVLTESGKVYAFGWNKGQRLGVYLDNNNPSSLSSVGRQVSNVSSVANSAQNSISDFAALPVMTNTNSNSITNANVGMNSPHHTSSNTYSNTTPTFSALSSSLQLAPFSLSERDNISTNTHATPFAHERGREKERSSLSILTPIPNFPNSPRIPYSSGRSLSPHISTRSRSRSRSRFEPKLDSPRSSKSTPKFGSISSSSRAISPPPPMYRAESPSIYPSQSDSVPDIPEHREIILENSHSDNKSENEEEENDDEETEDNNNSFTDENIGNNNGSVNGSRDSTLSDSYQGKKGTAIDIPQRTDSPRISNQHHTPISSRTRRGSSLVNLSFNNPPLFNSLPSSTTQSIASNSTFPEFITEPTRVLFPENITITQVIAGETVSLACTSDGYVYSWGQQNSGLLGSNNLQDRLFPQLVEELYGYSVQSIALGSSHAIALLQSGKIVTWGSNKFGQLGRNVDVNNTTNSSHSQYYEPGYVMLSDDTDSNPIVSICAGKAHCMAITSEGGIITWGKNANGVLGLTIAEDKNMVSYPTTIEYFEPIPEDELLFTAVSGSWSHTAAISQDGQLYTCGARSQGKLGY